MFVLEKFTQSNSQQVEVVDVASHVEGVLHGPDDLICHHVIGEEHHEVIGEANCIDADSQKEGQCETSKPTLATGPYLEEEETKKKRGGRIQENNGCMRKM